eukprot:m.1106234 g.1106234  ORF g.1106234 m.1106234 type:complete len:527 (+) comp24342_c0_seq6:1238-2818(+)
MSCTLHWDAYILVPHPLSCSPPVLLRALVHGSVCCPVGISAAGSNFARAIPGPPKHEVPFKASEEYAAIEGEPEPPDVEDDGLLEILMKVYVAKRGYTASDDDELSFAKGEHIYVAREDDDGWWLAVRQSNGDVGFVPNTFLDDEPISSFYQNMPKELVGEGDDEDEEEEEDDDDFDPSMLPSPVAIPPPPQRTTPTDDIPAPVAPPPTQAPTPPTPVSPPPVPAVRTNSVSCLGPQAALQAETVKAALLARGSLKSIGSSSTDDPDEKSDYVSRDMTELQFLLTKGSLKSPQGNAAIRREDTNMDDMKFVLANSSVRGRGSEERDCTSPQVAPSPRPRTSFSRSNTLDSVDMVLAPPPAHPDDFPPPPDVGVGIDALDDIPPPPPPEMLEDSFGDLPPPPPPDDDDDEAAPPPPPPDVFLGDATDDSVPPPPSQPFHTMRHMLPRGLSSDMISGVSRVMSVRKTVKRPTGKKAPPPIAAKPRGKSSVLVSVTPHPWHLCPEVANSVALLEKPISTPASSLTDAPA